VASTTSGSRPTLLLALIMSTIAILGMGQSYIFLGSPPPEPSAFARNFDQIWAVSELGRGLAIANLLASVLLGVASFMVTAPRPSGLWWSAQALWANLAYTIADAAARCWTFYQHAAELNRALAHDAAATADQGWAPIQSIEIQWIEVAAQAAFMFAVYTLLIQLSRRPDVRRFVEEGAAPAEE
jgi:hypothetical protein